MLYSLLNRKIVFPITASGLLFWNKRSFFFIIWASDALISGIAAWGGIMRIGVYYRPDTHLLFKIISFERIFFGML